MQSQPERFVDENTEEKWIDPSQNKVIQTADTCKRELVKISRTITGYFRR